ncbi:MAG: alpha/beta fold hydrolase [Gammaproteobacteria bacterium]|nr:MAG: alpha/beta fold hydrolase [Gammaproteobacteria bacterium]
MLAPRSAGGGQDDEGDGVLRWLWRLCLGLATLLLLAWLGLVIYAYWPTGVDEVPARQLAGPEDRFIEVDGLELRYQDHGASAPGEPVFLLLHGFGNSLQSFRRLAPLLADHYRVITVDMPGFGLSAKPANRDYRNPSQAQLIADFIAALGLDNVVVGGHSLGGAIALRVALIAPQVSGLILMNPGIIETGVPAITKYLPFPFQRLSAKQFGDREFREQFLKQSYMDPSLVTDEVMDELMKAPRSEGYLAGTTAMMGQYEDASEVPLLAEVRVPVLIAWGERDRRKTPEELAALQAGLSNAPVVRVARAPNAGHYVHEEAPELVAEAIIEMAPLWKRQ